MLAFVGFMAYPSTENGKWRKVKVATTPPLNSQESAKFYLFICLREWIPDGVRSMMSKFSRIRAESHPKNVCRLTPSGYRRVETVGLPRSISCSRTRTAKLLGNVLPRSEIGSPKRYLRRRAEISL